MKIESENKVLIITPFAIIEKKGIIENGRLQKKRDKITLCTNSLRKARIAFNMCCVMCESETPRDHRW